MKNKKAETTRKIKSYTKYSGLAYQMFGLLAISIWLGLKADKYFGFDNNYITALGSLLVLFAFFYKISMEVLKPNVKKDQNQQDHNTDD